MTSGKTKPFLLFFVSVGIFALALGQPSNQKDIYADCLAQIDNGFIHNSQPLKALLTGNEVAEFRTTLFDGNIYRITTCSPTNQKIWFSLYDTNDNLLFSTTGHSYSPYWDFKMEGNMECRIEAGLMPGSGSSGMAVLLIAFKNIVPATY